jgi:cation/acetate symporter
LGDQYCLRLFTYVTAQIFGTGPSPRAPGMQFEIAVFAILAACSAMPAACGQSPDADAQYIVLTWLFLTLIVILSTQHFGIPIP